MRLKIRTFRRDLYYCFPCLSFVNFHTRLRQAQNQDVLFLLSVSVFCEFPHSSETSSKSERFIEIFTFRVYFSKSGCFFRELYFPCLFWVNFYTRLTQAQNQYGFLLVFRCLLSGVFLVYLHIRHRHNIKRWQFSSKGLDQKAVLFLPVCWTPNKTSNPVGHRRRQVFVGRFWNLSSHNMKDTCVRRRGGRGGKRGKNRLGGKNSKICQVVLFFVPVL